MEARGARRTPRAAVESGREGGAATGRETREQRKGIEHPPKEEEEWKNWIRSCRSRVTLIAGQNNLRTGFASRRCGNDEEIGCQHEL